MTETSNPVDLVAKRASLWMYRKREGVSWWTHQVLTPANPDLSNPHLSLPQAQEVFRLLAEKGFLHYLGDLVSGSQSVPAYAISSEKLKEFKKFAGLGWWYWDWFVKLKGKFPGLLWASLILIVTAFFQSLFGKFGEWVFTKILK